MLSNTRLVGFNRRQDFNAGGGGGDAHQYWRITSITLGAGGDYLEISDLQVFEDAANVTANATVTSSEVPLSDPGSPLSNLTDNNVGTRCYWPAANVQTGESFWIKFDFGAAQILNGVTQAGFDTSSRYMAAFSLQYSDNDSDWTTFGSKANLTYPGNGTFSNVYTFP